ncbi:MAG: hypothetical protein COB07_07690 [Sulfurovum sp.]|nr:MAG: hypothetical protein COB07_07690 [Sulfurovum sp.]
MGIDKTCIRMYCEFEGSCHGIVLIFFDEPQKKNILAKVNEMAERHRVVPDVSTRDMKGYGEVFVEFYDEYHREGACFFEDLVEILNAKLCDCEEM